MSIVSGYILYIRNIRRYSERTTQIYEHVLQDFVAYACEGDTSPSDNDILENLIPSRIRSYEVSMLDADPPKTSRTVNLHLSVLSGFCKYLIYKAGYPRVTHPSATKDSQDLTEVSSA